MHVEAWTVYLEMKHVHRCVYSVIRDETCTSVHEHDCDSVYSFM
jgi:hypothetical protein